MNSFIDDLYCINILPIIQHNKILNIYLYNRINKNSPITYNLNLYNLVKVIIYIKMCMLYNKSQRFGSVVFKLGAAMF